MGFFKSDGSLGRAAFVFCCIFLSVLNLLAITTLLRALGLSLLGEDGGIDGRAGSAIAAWASIPASVAMGVLAGRRCRDAGIPVVIAFLTAIPVLSVSAFLILAIAPSYSLRSLTRGRS